MLLSKSSVNPAWPHFLGVSATLLACILGFCRLLFTGLSDPLHCRALLNDGSWLDSNHGNWQPNGCMLHPYTEKEAATCLKSREIIFIGDSVARKLFFQIGHLLDATLPGLPADATKKHANHTLYTKYGTNLTFAWDPFLNTSYTQWILTEARSKAVSHSDPAPAMLVLGSGLWYLRYAHTSGGLSAWENNMEHIFESLSTRVKPADKVVILPIEEVTLSKLSPDRASTMHPSDIDAMNSDLYHRINPPSKDFKHIFSTPNFDVALPLVFNKMLDESLTEDGLHFSDAIVKIQANILINLRCNDVMPKAFPLNKTCCNRYPWPSLLQSIFLILALISGPYLSYKAFSLSLRAASLKNQILPQFIISLSLALIFLADRTNFWEKEQKHFNPWTFGVLCCLSLAVGLATVKRGESDFGFLNRDQTDEWKGWMQIVILIYHYFGASQVSGIYNPIRVLVASYLFMTGYGHTTFYLRKADFGFLRIAQVLIRLNLFTVILAYTMNTNYISYYFTPLVSMWYIVVYTTMVLGARFNDRAPVLLGKILLSAAVMNWFMSESWLLEALFDALHRFCAIRWSSEQWAFRTNLDIWIVYVGMLAAILVTKIRESRLTDHYRWSLITKGSIAGSALVMVWFFAFELYQESKFTYNTWHPYISLLPILAFTVLRNSSTVLRSSYSRAFAFVGKCSLETFVIQYHFWLAGDTKGILLAVPGTRWRQVNFIVTTTMFLYLCDRVAYATGEITTVICGTRNRELPFPTTTAMESVIELEGQVISIPLTRVSGLKDDAGNALPIEPDTPIRPGRWVDRLAESSSQTSSRNLQHWFNESSWTWRLDARILLFLGFLWLFNLLWAYPPGI
ncbi:hypothetical protein GALMADRAFT_298941 [Galerina marginata CBS 339.88]|uniref:Cas1p 10 TM acyl transferase domain-containing protein n=1 Tax=Galerina marginata (strain CBS 339.88) TaxID=685588 RepID=A0A067TY25_GALM3|nr:hypothetical protein GALMADRAFT_298941 [Galerina marginata CBS 339.88]